jgi:hypothetical protein
VALVRSNCYGRSLSDWPGRRDTDDCLSSLGTGKPASKDGALNIYAEKWSRPTLKKKKRFGQNQQLGNCSKIEHPQRA